MDKRTISKTKSRIINGKRKKTFLLFHGYSGGPDDFSLLPELLNKEFNVKVVVPLLKGHGTVVSDMYNYSHKDYIVQAEKELKKELENGNSVILGGFSFGGQLALYLAGKYPIEKVFVISTPYKLSFGLSSRVLTNVAKLKKKWKKKLNPVEKKLREKAFYYDFIPGRSLEIVNNLNKLLKKHLPKITCPVIAINAKSDTLIPKNSGNKLLKKINSTDSESFIISYSSHNIFFHPKNKLMFDKVIEFLKK
ncbi:alpha/beta fold hydrolase [archaeon]|jgi:carboxylesterase|nr:alpha/beta fold hydrolase [archaeon]MBT4241421.1 alpha/beta fold hydrolase [archaeon]MBT4417708.1 alpha/beta fold hydrolase [archaeon]